MSKPLIVFSTCGSRETAQKIASELIANHLAACVNIVESVHSTYRWQDKIVSESETMMIIKTVSKHEDQIQRTLQRMTGYDLPEVITLEIDGGSKEYLAWLVSETE